MLLCIPIQAVLICQLDLNMVLMVIFLVQVMQFISLLLSYYYIHTIIMIETIGPNLSTNSQHASDEVVDLATGKNVLLAINYHKHKSI